MSTDVLLIDAFNLIRRVFEARSDRAGAVENLASACAASVRRALQQHAPSHACVVFDSHETTWRHLLYPGYKANRKPTPALLLEHLPLFRSAFLDAGIRSLMIGNYEADDVIATLAEGVSANGGLARILSTDSMFGQLLSAQIHLFNHFESREVTIAQFEDHYGVSIGQLTDFWAMAGDAGNNIKGVPKVGAKTAARLLARYDCLEDILRGEDDDPRAERVRQYGDLALGCKKLVTLETHVELGMNLKSLRLSS